MNIIFPNILSTLCIFIYFNVGAASNVIEVDMKDGSVYYSLRHEDWTPDWMEAKKRPTIFDKYKAYVRFGQGMEPHEYEDLIQIGFVGGRNLKGAYLPKQVKIVLGFQYLTTSEFEYYHGVPHLLDDTYRIFIAIKGTNNILTAKMDVREYDEKAAEEINKDVMKKRREKMDRELGLTLGRGENEQQQRVIRASSSRTHLHNSIKPY